MYLNTVWNNASKQHIVGESQQVFQVFSFGLYKDPESLVDNRQFKVRPHICYRCRGNCRWFSSALNLLLANADELIKCNFLLLKITGICAFLMKLCQKVVGVQFFFDSRYSCSLKYWFDLPFCHLFMSVCQNVKLVVLSFSGCSHSLMHLISCNSMLGHTARLGKDTPAHQAV